MLLANKSDQPYDAVKEPEVQQFMKEYGITLFREVSAKTGNQVGEAFRVLGERLMGKVRKREETRKERVGLKESKMSHPDVPESQEKRGCCR